MVGGIDFNKILLEMRFSTLSSFFVNRVENLKLKTIISILIFLHLSKWLIIMHGVGNEDMTHHDYIF